MKVNLRGDHILQFPPKAELQVCSVIAPTDTQKKDAETSLGPKDSSQTNFPQLTKHSILLTPSQLKISPELPNKGLSPSGELTLVLLNSNHEANEKLLREKVEHLSRLGEIATKRLAVNTLGGAAIGSALGTMCRSAYMGALSFHPIGWGIGLVLGGVGSMGFSYNGSKKNDELKKSLNEVLIVFDFFNKLATDSVPEDQALEFLESFEKKRLNLSGAPRSAFSEIERFLIALQDPEAIELMRKFLVKKSNIANLDSRS